MEKELITLKTNMTCGSCIAKVKPALQSIGIFESLEFNMNSSDKTVQFLGSKDQVEKSISTLKKLGYEATPLVQSQRIFASLSEEKVNFLATYKPLILLGVFLLGVTALTEIKVGSFDVMHAMRTFMGGFFISFSFFKFLGLSAFADAFSTYDVIAKKSRAYALAYPFIELVLGVAFILDFFSVVVNFATIVLMTLGNMGVWMVLRKKQAIQCACLGTVFKLPMTSVTLFENTLMLIMSIITLIAS